MNPTMQVFERGWLSSNNILFHGRERSVLVDTGYLSHAAQTLGLVRHALGTRRLDCIVNTHLHSDHCGGNAVLAAHFDPEVIVARSRAEIVARWDQAELAYADVLQQCERFHAHASIAPGEEIELGDQTWQVWAAPGHDPHSLMLYCEASRTLLSADALWQNGFGVIFPELDGLPGFGDTRATLDTIARLAPDHVVPGHGAPFSGDAVSQALARAYTRIDGFEREPGRNAQYALKVLLKFVLLERRSIPLAELPELLASADLFERSARHLGIAGAAVADWAVEQLCRSGAARIEHGCLLNFDAQS